MMKTVSGLPMPPPATLCRTPTATVCGFGDLMTNGVTGIPKHKRTIRLLQKETIRLRFRDEIYTTPREPLHPIHSRFCLHGIVPSGPIFCMQCWPEELSMADTVSG